MITFVPIDMDAPWWNGHRHRQQPDRHVSLECFREPAWYDCQKIRIGDNGRKHMKSGHADRILAANAVPHQHLVDHRISHPRRISDSMRGAFECFDAHSRSKIRMARAHDTYIAFLEQDGL